MAVATKNRCGGCHGCGTAPISSDEAKDMIALVGTPNVGKSVVFGQLTGTYVAVSNYPGTTVEITRGKGKLGDVVVEVCDTPGMYAFLPITEEERVARSILLTERPAKILHVADAKNIERMLMFTLQLLEAELPVVLVLNLMDEAERLGMRIDASALETTLGIPVVPTVATEGRGIAALRNILAAPQQRTAFRLSYDETIEAAIAQMVPILPDDFPLAPRAVALLLLQDDAEIAQLMQDRLGETYLQVEQIVTATRQRYTHPLTYVITMARQEMVHRLLANVVIETRPAGRDVRETLSRIMMHPLAGIPILLAIIYGFFELVGVFGAQTAVDFLENTVFGAHINPVVTHWVEAVIPWPVLQDLFVHQYGIITLGIRYAIAIILPIVTTFFIAFSILEDSGYLPRLAMLIDRIFKKIGLNGRAVIPMVLGFGCATMATIVTRTLETKRERVIATFLLGLSIPCSAQLGVILALLAGHALSLWIFLGVMAVNFLVVGYLTAQLLPGEKPVFYMEVPPLRWPKPSNVLVKTYTRVEWYFKEILPLFIIASVLIWLGRLTGLFNLLVTAMSYPVRWIGLPGDAAVAFLYGFFRRDYGAAGLYDLQKTGALHGIAVVVAVVTMALFMPCIAQFSVTWKERGWKMALGMAAFIFPYAFAVGFLVNGILHWLHLKL